MNDESMSTIPMPILLTDEEYENLLKLLENPSDPDWNELEEWVKSNKVV